MGSKHVGQAGGGSTASSSVLLSRTVMAGGEGFLQPFPLLPRCLYWLFRILRGGLNHAFSIINTDYKDVVII